MTSSCRPLPEAGSRQSGDLRFERRPDRQAPERVYLYRAADKIGNTIDFMLSEHRDERAVTAFFKQAINSNGLLESGDGLKAVQLCWIGEYQLPADAGRFDQFC
jgi:hypothetical protein